MKLSNVIAFLADLIDGSFYRDLDGQAENKKLGWGSWFAGLFTGSSWSKDKQRRITGDDAVVNIAYLERLCENLVRWVESINKELITEKRLRQMLRKINILEEDIDFILGVCQVLVFAH